MNIEAIKEQQKLTVIPDGRINTTTAHEFETSLNDIEGISELVIDFAKVAYISSAGLRVILKTCKTMKKQGSMKIINVSDDVMDVFEIAGFLDIVDIEK